MSGTHGLTETKEVISAVKGLAIDAIGAAKDGLDLDDLNVLFKNLKPLQEALDGIKQVGEELGDLQMDEIREVADLGLDLVFSIIKTLKEAKAVAEATESPATPQA